jgi:hypothetical protein
MKHTTHPQPHEQLLVGWIVDGPTITMTEGDGGDATTTTAASPCLQGGRGDNNRREGR